MPSLAALLHTLVQAAIPVSKPPSQLAKARRARCSDAAGVRPKVLCCVWSAAESTSPEITDTEYHQRLRVIKNTAAEYPNSGPRDWQFTDSVVVSAGRTARTAQASEVLLVNAARRRGTGVTRVLLYSNT